ncbi:imidazolonepropionase [Clostridium algidicarnis]|uniref:Imidazolonepropionase n=2 Tax=Clostridium algidicarnis TaxID=37659 RepID=A0A2S6FWL2_9CLOT|nr:imidazolonepropionase [Clostridium algidicarnis]MBB6632027.1 imidazolonepropionase [Clostridium algidicarnis]MBB6697303.1 imidazolonepropionase [Clostridium algidicarnis]MBU3219109.1 imidazolonepropionase [Clostridium algidicarnis]MCB2287329.1 imidazolonepropionase [Clostridium algidicarnis]PPK47927.1 imidazolonepropionase [Clostridium algidicarnis DSM 15099]
MKNKIIIKDASEIVTCSGFEAKKGKEMQDIAVIYDGAIIIEDGIIKDIGISKEVLKDINEEEYEVISAKGRAVLPGFVDSHTHFVFGGYRAEEFSWRLKGDSYMSIMERGGGIVNSVESTRKATEEELYSLGQERLDSMLKFGITTVEGKSGYGLDIDTELKQLKVMERLNKDHTVDVVSTFLGAHATPKEYKDRTDDYVKFIINEVLPKAKDKAEFCDVFCEKNVFSIEQSREILKAAKSLGMKIKLHADEIVQLGGAELAGELGATSADHLLQASDKGIKDMAKAGTVATLLPCTAFSLKESFARGREMIDSGCAVALATDLNPGSCFTNSIPLMFALACLQMDLSIEEAITALTINGAAALDRADKIGSLDVGKKADIIMLKYPSYKFIPYNIGMNTVDMVIKSGKVVI